MSPYQTKAICTGPMTARIATRRAENGRHVVSTFLGAGQLNGKPQPEQKGKERVELVDDEKLHDWFDNPVQRCRG